MVSNKCILFVYECTTRATDAFCIADSIIADESVRPIQINLNSIFTKKKFGLG